MVTNPLTSASPDVLSIKKQQKSTAAYQPLKPSTMLERTVMGISVKRGLSRGGGQSISLMF